MRRTVWSIVADVEVLTAVRLEMYFADRTAGFSVGLNVGYGIKGKG